MEPICPNRGDTISSFFFFFFRNGGILFYAMLSDSYETLFDSGCQWLPAIILWGHG
jgi:hypothetical protein